MKKIFFIIFLISLIVSSSYSAEYHVKIKISSKDQIRLLKPFILKFDDVKEVRENKFIYNEENNYVTAVCNESQLGSLKSTSFKILEVIKTENKEETIRDNSHSILPYQFGWPRQSSIDWPFYYSSATVADMNNDGPLELSVTHSFSTQSPPLLYVYKNNGAFVSGFPFQIPFGTLQNSGSREISAMGDIDGDGVLDIVHADENGNVYVHKYDGSMISGFPFSTGATNEHSIPAIVDVNRDGKAEIIITSRDRNNDQNAQLHVLTWLGSSVGNLSGFPVSYTIGSTSSPVVADIDNDDVYEIIVGTGYSSSLSYNARILCYTSDGAVKPGWPVIVGPYSVGASATLYDINNDNKLDIIIRVKSDLVPNSINGIYAFNYTGSLISPFPFEVTSGHPDANVSIADMDGDGQIEIGFGSVLAVSLAEVFVFKLNGQMLPGYPNRVYATWVDGSTAMADVSGDGLPDIIAPTNNGQIYAFNSIGDSVVNFPLNSEATSLNAFNSSPTMVDLDGDGDVELIAPCNDRKIYVWDTPGIYNAMKTWSTYKGNYTRSGTQFPDILVSIGNEANEIPDQFYLSQNFPNPFNPSTVIKFGLPTSQKVRLSVYNITGEKIDELINGNLNGGTHSFVWNAGKFSSGIYFYKLEAGNFIETKKMLLIK